MQAAAADCMRALSRSARGLRFRLADAAVAGPLVALLRSATHPDVQAAAAAALCNLVLDFSPVKVYLVFLKLEKTIEQVFQPSSSSSSYSWLLLWAHSPRA